MILLLKAAVAGGAAADLFATQVDVAGYVNANGTYVAPHRGIRHKRQAEPQAPAQGSLFEEPKKAGAAQPSLFEDAPAPEKGAAQVLPTTDGLHRLADFITRHGGKDALGAQLGRAKPAERDRAVKLMAGIGGVSPHQVETLLGLHGPAGEAAVEAPKEEAAPAAAPEPPTEAAPAGFDDVFKMVSRRKVGGGGKTTPGDEFTFSGTLDGQALELRSRVRTQKENASFYTPSNARIHYGMTGRVVADDQFVDIEVRAKEPVSDATLHKIAAMAQKVDARPVLVRRKGEPVRTGVDASGDAGPDEARAPLQWGVPAGTTKKARKAANARALELLKEKADGEMTADDRAALARYTGRGGVGDSLNEFYTDPAVAGAMWSMLANLGFAGGEVLEPSSGTGVFLHTAPAGARVTAVELDPTSARIARILHAGSGHEVNNASLERFATQDGRTFDAVIGNVPFGLRGTTLKDDKPDLSTADQYFVDTALDKCRDGGLVALIVPTGIMDSKTGRAFRERVLRKAEFLGAHRLPNTAFEASHTEVTSDIVVFRKRPQDAAGALSTLSQEQLQALNMLYARGLWDSEFLGGTYFTEGRGAANVMGRLEEGWRAKAGIGQDITVTGSMDGVPAALAAWRPEDLGGQTPSVQQILESLGDDAAAKRRAVNAALKNPYQVAKPGDVKVIDGVRYVLQGEPPRWHRAEGEVPGAVEDAHRIAELLEDLAEGRARDPFFVRAGLIEALDDYVREHGVPHRNKDLRRWLAAPSLPQGEGVEPEDHRAHVEGTRRRVARLLGAVHDDGTYSDLVTGRTRETGGADLDTVATKLALESGGFTVDQLAAAWGSGDRDAVLDHLFASPAYAVDPDGQTWTTMDAYLSGELWAKHDAAMAAAAHEGLAAEFAAKYRAQAKALEEAIAPQSLEDVDIAVNSGFVTPEVLTAWFTAQDEAFRAAHPNAPYAPGLVDVTYDDGVYSVKRRADQGHGWLPPAADLLERILNRSGVRKDEKDKVDQLNKDFREWLLASAWRDQVEESYNRTYRGYRAKAFSDAPIAIPGLNPALDVNRYHFAGLRWALEAGKGIIAADVGLGKTGRGLMLARLAKVTGQAKKPTFVVPKSVLANWMAEAEFWFPGSKVLVIGETYSRDKQGALVSKPDNEETRRRKYHELQQNDYDFVFISQPAWNDLDVDPITKGKYANDDFWTKRGDKLGNAGDKRLKQIRTAYEQALAKREFADREETIYFNQLGIDMLLLDEGHAYKNLYAARNRFGESPKFLGGSGLSNRAQDTNFKTRAVREANGGKGVFMLTATPTKNSPLEVYSMLSHIAPEAFERMGIKNSEDFLDRFCEFKMDTILTVDGVLDEAVVTAGFKNLDELREVMKRFIDRKTAEDVGLKLPARQDHQHLIEMTPEQEAVYQELREAAAEKAKGDDTGDAHIFSIMDKMGKASIDLALLGPQHKGARSPKIETVAANVAKLSADGGQVVFCDHVDVHEKIAAALVAAGIPREHIGIINAKAASSSAARQRIADDFNARRLKVVIGNTATMGEGVNLQKGTTDIHHCDLPWEPSSLQQRNGRGLRQGNLKESVRVHTYLAKGSFDGYRYQTIAAKKDWQDLLWNGGDRVENLAREGAFSRTDMLIMLAANPEEARAQYEADKKAAEERKTTEERGRVVDMFGKFQEMTNSFKEMKARGAKGTSFDRLRLKMERLRETLRDSRYFTHKDLLDMEEAALIEPVTNYAWTKGKAFEMAGGPDAPMNWSAEPSKWVVVGVHRDSGTVVARQYGSASGHRITVDIAAMKSGITPFQYDQAEEEKAIEEAASKAAEGNANRAKKPADLRHLPADLVERLEPVLQEQLKTAVRKYQDGHHGPYGMVASDGTPVAVESYRGRDAINSHDLILPTPKGRELAIRGYVDAMLGRKIKTRYQESRRGRGGYGTSKAVGIEPAYPGFEYGNSKGNPWESIIRELFGDEVKAEAERDLHRRVLARIGSALNFTEAVRAALPTVNVPAYGSGSLAHGAWPAETVRALARKAKALGVLDRPLKDVTETSRYDDGAKVHPDVFNVLERGRPYSGTGGHTTIRDFAAKMMPTDQDAAALLEELK